MNLIWGSQATEEHADIYRCVHDEDLMVVDDDTGIAYMLDCSKFSEAGSIMADVAEHIEREANEARTAKRLRDTRILRKILG